MNSEISNSQTAHDVESESSAHKVYPANGSVKKLLSEFAVESRHLSESGRDNAAKFIVNKLQSSGWNVTQKKFPVYRYKNIFSEPYNISENGEPVGTGNNIIAELPNFDRNKPTLILSAHYDTTKDNVGIIDNGSGTAFLLSSGEWLSDFDRDFNLRLIFFDVEESRMYGSKYYLEQLTDEERSKGRPDLQRDQSRSAAQIHERDRHRKEGGGCRRNESQRKNRRAGTRNHRLNQSSVGGASGHPSVTAIGVRKKGDKTCQTCDH